MTSHTLILLAISGWLFSSLIVALLVSRKAHAEIEREQDRNSMRRIAQSCAVNQFPEPSREARRVAIARQDALAGYVDGNPVTSAWGRQ